MLRIMTAIRRLARITNSQRHRQQDAGLCGPRANAQPGAPKDGGFELYSVPVPGVLSRSGQPNSAQFAWLRAQGCKTVINLREGGPGHEHSDDANVPGYKELGFKTLRLHITDGDAPTDGQTDHFLSFMRTPENLPAHLHCNLGISRTGALTAAYRYSIQGWPLKRAIAEAALFGSGLTRVQISWLKQWAAKHKPGGYACVDARRCVP